MDIRTTALTRQSPVDGSPASRRLTFWQYLEQQAHRNDAVGRLAQRFGGIRKWTPDSLWQHIMFKTESSDSLFEALAAAKQELREIQRAARA